MNHVNTDQKLKLVQTIRMQNQFNRMKCRERENLLYGTPAVKEKRELYGAEMAMSLPVNEAADSMKSSGLLMGFRIRFFIALALFSAFIYLDKNDISLFGKNTFDLFLSITESIELPPEITKLLD